jgi:hypothetical protein
MNYPNLITQEWLDTQHTPEDTRIVRVELSGCYNYRPVPVPGKRSKRYLFLHDSVTSCHVLNIPESAWMAQDAAMARDLMASAAHSYTLAVLILPISKPSSTAAAKPLPKPKAIKPAQKSAEDAAMAVLAG